jgi:sulfur-carrier protein adenylyltransferase/sulfurtransferase
MIVPRIASAELKRRMDDAVTAPFIVDVRLKYPYEHSTITLPGALRTGPGSVDRSRLAADREVVLYDSDPGEIVAEQAAADLIAAGYRVSVLEGGIAQWAASRFPTCAKPAPQLAVPVSGVSKG